MRYAVWGDGPTIKKKNGNLWNKTPFTSTMTCPHMPNNSQTSAIIDVTWYQDGFLKVTTSGKHSVNVWSMCHLVILLSLLTKITSLSGSVTGTRHSLLTTSQVPGSGRKKSLCEAASGAIGRDESSELAEKPGVMRNTLRWYDVAHERWWSNGQNDSQHLSA